MSFGADTDYWAFTDTNTKLLSSTKSVSKSEAQCLDSNATVNASTMYDTFSEFSSTYQITTDAVRLLYDTTTEKDFRLGKVISSRVITSIEVSTENTSRPTVTISGQTCGTADGSVTKFDPSDIEIAGSRKATKIGASVDTNSKLLSSTGSATVSIAKALDSNGVECFTDVYGGRVEATNNFVGCGGAPGAAADTGWTLSAGPSREDENTSYQTGAITVFKNLAPV